MPAYFESGFSVREPMWHCGYDNTIDEYPEDWEHARKLAGLAWEPHSVMPTYMVPADVAETLDLTTLPDGWAKNENGSLLVPDPTHRIIVRDDTWAPLAAVSDTFELISHAQMGELLEAFIQAGSGKLRFETAGSVKGGAQVWALVYLDEPYTTPGDQSETLPFTALLNAHDGTGACKALYTQVRVVCWNTFQMASAEGDRTGAQWVIRHAGNVEERLEDAKQAIGHMREERDAYVELASEMAKLNVNDRQVQAFLEEFIPSPADHGIQITDRVKGNIDKAREMFRHIYMDSPTTEGVRGTAWGLVQASTEYLDHSRGFRNRDSYLGRSILRSEPAKAKALTLARTVAK